MMLRPFSAMILAAGFGKRMLPLTKKIPKPLIKINNVSLLKITIEFLFKIGCKKIVINTHFKHELISDFISQYYKSSNIIISHENDILDTGGGVKNAIPLFDDKNIVVINSDIFWKQENEKDVIQLVSNFKLQDQCRLLLVEKKKAHGIGNKSGDFSLQNNIVKRWKNNDKILYYSGLQIIDLDVFKHFNFKKFSFNKIWDFQINKNSLYGKLMSSNWYHVGDLKGLQEIINLTT